MILDFDDDFDVAHQAFLKDCELSIDDIAILDEIDVLED